MLGLAFLSAWIARAEASPTYSIIDLGTLPGTTQSIATGINASGQVVGVSYSGSGSFTSDAALQYLGISYDAGAKSFLYSGGRMSGINPTDGPANAINDAGQIVGGSYPSINNVGQYVGVSPDRLISGGSATTLNYFLPTSINDLGVVGGVSYPASGGYSHAALYQNGQVTDLSNTLGLKGIGDTVLAINKAGDVLIAEGLMGGANPVHYLLYVPSAGPPTDLTKLPGGSGLAALALNNKDQVVGTGFLYSDGQFTSLQSLLPSTSHWSNLNATGINDAGQIVGQGLIDGQEHAFLMTPQNVPEPTTLTVFTLGLATFVARRLFRRGTAQSS